jgi:hypothetical protein
MSFWNRGRYILCILGCVMLASIVAGYIGYTVALRNAKGSVRTLLFLQMCGLEDLRSGKTQDGMKLLEIVAFKHGLALLGDHSPLPTGATMPIALLGEYRRKWRSDRSAWSQEERRLDKLLAEYPPLTRLMGALHDGASIAVIKEIVEADPGVIRESQEPIVIGDPVAWAASACQTDVVEYLVEKGAETDTILHGLRAIGDSNAVRIIEDARHRLDGDRRK